MIQYSEWKMAWSPMMRGWWFIWSGVVLLLGWCLASGETAEPESSPLPDRIQFDRDIRQILSDNCFACHGPDQAKRKAKLRLDTQEGAIADHEGRAAIVPGDLGKSELYRRITSADEDEHMPPGKSGKKLTNRQMELLKRWIEQKAPYSVHWAFVPPARTALPEVKNTAWPRKPVDRFILARLEQEGLNPSPEADKTTLIRRVTLDLTGLPPTLAELDAFLADQAPDAYEKVVERLLESPHYGERMALEWLDAARYADTHGFHLDSGREMTHWRDWVINAFNRNMPFDQFTVEQLAGDLLPDATADQRIASGFNRNNMITFEGGTIPEEALTTYVMDRVNTTSTVWLGLTVACAQCHDHKFDPITQRDFYRLYAFFNNVPENPTDGAKGNAAPVVKVPTPEQKQKMDHLSASIARLESRLAGPISDIDASQREWEKAAISDKPAEWITLDPSEFRSAGGATLSKLDDKSIRATGLNPAKETYTIIAQPNLGTIRAIRLEVFPEENNGMKWVGRSDNGNIVLTGVQVALNEKNSLPVTIKMASADYNQAGLFVANVINEKDRGAWGVWPQVARSHFAIFELDKPIEQSKSAPLKISIEFQSQFANHQPGRFRLSVTSSKYPHEEMDVPGNIRRILEIAQDKRNEMDQAILRKHYRTIVSEELRTDFIELEKLKKTEADMRSKISTTMVMQEMDKPRPSHVLMRGQYDKPGEAVKAGLPAIFGELPPGTPANRLALAQWLVNPKHPLTARVIVNRYWQMYFGTGLVKTSEDFGSQGEWPSHPQLLDWLAKEFIESGWNVKAMQRLIATSATYRQVSNTTPELFARDPEDRLLARSPRLRLQAEFVRDLALSTSGLLNKTIGGESVFPYQPTGLWEELMQRSDGKQWTAQVYTPSHGEDLYRRGMYTFWKRTSPPPNLSTFDAPSREVCTVRRARTNTPLQSLVLLNDPTYVETARKLAERMMTEGGESAEKRITFAFRLVTSRVPSQKEVPVLQRIYQSQLSFYKNDKDAAMKLLAVGESKRNDALDPAELAAWTMTASSILNLDESITRN